MGLGLNMLSRFYQELYNEMCVFLKCSFLKLGMYWGDIVIWVIFDGGIFVTPKSTKSIQIS